MTDMAAEERLKHEPQTLADMIINTIEPGAAQRVPANVKTLLTKRVVHHIRQAETAARKAALEEAAQVAKPQPLKNKNDPITAVGFAARQGIYEKLCALAESEKP